MLKIVGEPVKQISKTAGLGSMWDGGDKNYS